MVCASRLRQTSVGRAAVDEERILFGRAVLLQFLNKFKQVNNHEEKISLVEAIGGNFDFTSLVTIYGFPV